MTATLAWSVGLTCFELPFPSNFWSNVKPFESTLVGWLTHWHEHLTAAPATTYNQFAHSLSGFFLFCSSCNKVYVCASFRARSLSCCCTCKSNFIFYEVAQCLGRDTFASHWRSLHFSGHYFYRLHLAVRRGSVRRCICWPTRLCSSRNWTGKSIVEHINLLVRKLHRWVKFISENCTQKRSATKVDTR